MSKIQVLNKTLDSVTKLVILHSNQPVTTSLKVAEVFEKEHKNVIRDIRKLIADANQLKIEPVKMFDESTYIDKKNEQRPMYYMNRDGFTLLAMGFTGEKALRFKLAYINAFNRMEEELKTINASQFYPSKLKGNEIEIVSKIADGIQSLFATQRGIAISRAIDVVSSELDLKSLISLKELIPPAEHDTGYLNSTRIGQKLGGIPAQEVNKMLAQKGFQYKDDKDWRLTELGKNYGEEMPYTRNNHSGYQIRWNEEILEVLSA